MVWQVRYLSGIEKQLRKLGHEPERRIRRYLDDHVATLENPRDVGHSLLGPLSGYWRYRVGDYRIICRILDDEVIVLVVEIGHRREVYR